MKTAIYNEQKARAVLAAKSTAELIKIFEQTTERKGQGVYMLRGWLMDEIEKRDPAGFNAWLERYAADNALFYYIDDNRTGANNLTESDEEIINEAIWYAEHSKNGLTLSNVMDWLKINNDGFISPRNILAVEHYVDAVIINKKRTEAKR